MKYLMIFRIMAGYPLKEAAFNGIIRYLAPVKNRVWASYSEVLSVG